MVIDINTTAIDVALNLSGSLTGFPAVIEQMPVGKRVGFDVLPDPWDDVKDIGQTWTPYIVGMDLEFDIPIYNPEGVEKGPYTTDISGLTETVDYGCVELAKVFGVMNAYDLPVGTNIRGMTFKFKRLDLEVARPNTLNEVVLYCNPQATVFNGGINNVGSLTLLFNSQALKEPSRVFYRHALGAEPIWYIPDGYKAVAKDDKDYIIAGNALSRVPVTPGKWSYKFVEVYKEEIL